MINPDGVRIEIEADGVKEMEGLLRLCREQGIKVLLVYSPEYHEMQKLTTNRAQVFAHFDELHDQFDVPCGTTATRQFRLASRTFTTHRT